MRLLHHDWRRSNHRRSGPCAMWLRNTEESSSGKVRWQGCAGTDQCRPHRQLCTAAAGDVRVSSVLALEFSSAHERASYSDAPVQTSGMADGPLSPGLLAPDARHAE